MNARTLPRFTLASYLAWEDDQAERHEFHRGDVFPVDCGRRVHGTVVGNVAGELGMRLKGSACRVFHGGMQAHIGDDTVLYPDLFITCDHADLTTENIFKAPSVVIEVLSSGTQAHDRSFKFALYRRIDTLTDHVVIDPETWRVDRFRRNGEGDWLLVDMNEGQSLDLPGMDLQVSFAEVFDGVDPPVGQAWSPNGDQD